MSKKTDSISDLAAQVSAPDGWLENSQPPADLPHRDHMWVIHGAPATNIERAMAQSDGHAFQIDAHGRVWHRPHEACYVSKAVRLDVDHYAPHRVDLSVDGVWMEDFAHVAEAQAWVAKVAAEPKPSLWERLWAWVSL